MGFIRYPRPSAPRENERHRLMHRSVFSLGGLEPHEGALEWQCPWCAYSVLFPAQDEVVAESAVRTHLLSRHGVKMWGDVVEALKTLQNGWR